MTVVIDLNDAGVSAWRGDTRLLVSPGYALVGDQRIEAVGESAWSRSRLQPRAVNDRFWDELGLEPAGGSAAGVLRTTADIACEHLAHVWAALGGDDAPGEVFIAVPGHYSREQLGLVLGIARECAMPVAGMMDAALAAVSRAQPGAATVLHLDVRLHRVVVTRFAQGEQLSRAGVETARGAGLADVRERWLGAIAGRFIESTRFDPLHDAHSEQRLYQLLEERLAEFATDRPVRLEVATSTRTHAAPIDGAMLADAAAEQYARIVELVRSATTPGEAVRLHLSHRAAALPGLQRELAAAPGMQIETLDERAVPGGVLACADALRGGDDEGVAYLTQIPWQVPGAAPDAAAAAGVAPARVPTHLLYEGIARPLGRRPLEIGSQVPAEAGVLLAAPRSGVSRRHCRIVLRGDGQAVLTDTSSHGTFLNGRRIEGEALLRAGDRLRVGTPGHEMQLVRVLD